MEEVFNSSVFDYKSYFAYVMQLHNINDGPIGPSFVFYFDDSFILGIGISLEVQFKFKENISSVKSVNVFAKS